MITRAWKVFGLDGHRQRESFNKSYAYDQELNGQISDGIFEDSRVGLVEEIV